MAPTVEHQYDDGGVESKMREGVQRLRERSGLASLQRRLLGDTLALGYAIKVALALALAHATLQQLQVGQSESGR